MSFSRISLHWSPLARCSAVASPLVGRKGTLVGAVTGIHREASATVEWETSSACARPAGSGQRERAGPAIGVAHPYHPSILPSTLPAPRSQLASPLVGPYEVIKLAVALTSEAGRSSSTPADDEDSDAIIERILVVIANVESGIEEAALLSSAFPGHIRLDG